MCRSLLCELVHVAEISGLTWTEASKGFQLGVKRQKGAYLYFSGFRSQARAGETHVPIPMLHHHNLGHLYSGIWILCTNNCRRASLMSAALHSSPGSRFKACINLRDWVLWRPDTAAFWAPGCAQWILCLCCHLCGSVIATCTVWT